MNVVVLRGEVRRDPVVRALASGAHLLSFDLAVAVPDRGTDTVPVSVQVDNADPPALVAAGAEVVVIGRVRRRFFRAGGATQSRTEVVADTLLGRRQTKRVRTTLAAVARSLEEGDNGR